MICSTSSFSRASCLGALLVFSGCASWSGPVGAPLAFVSLTSDAQGPGVARSAAIRWTALANGGVGARRYEFRSLNGTAEVVEQEGTFATWTWNPRKAGTFRLRARVTDRAGAVVDSEWSAPYVVLPPIDRSARVAVLPVDNLTGDRAPVRALDGSLREHLRGSGFDLLDDESLDEFMKRHRVRNTSGLSQRASRGLATETGTEALLLTSLVAYADREPPRAALAARLVALREDPEILWTDSVGLSAAETAGLLGLGRVGEAELLLEKAVQDLTASLVEFLPESLPAPAALGAANDADFDGVENSDDVCPDFDDNVDTDGDGQPDGCDRCPADPAAGSGGEGACSSSDGKNGWANLAHQAQPEPCARSPFDDDECDDGVLCRTGDLPCDSSSEKYRPRTFYRSSSFDTSRRYSVVVLPFRNLSGRRNAGRILSLHFVEHLARNAKLTVVEPGLVREHLLKYRIIMRAGPSLANTDLISRGGSLDVDLVLSGTVFDYQDAIGAPEIDFSVEMIQARSREVVWLSRSRRHGDEGVFFFDWGRAHTAHGLASEMTAKTIELMMR